ncbi:MAG: hypothetical protein GY861_10270 [bacterium]|nr:hypothetical protein [bacterium]
MTYFIKYKGRFLDVKKVQELKAKELVTNVVETKEDASSELGENTKEEVTSVEVVIEPVEEEKHDDLDERKAFIEQNGKLDKRWKEKRIIEESDKLGFSN